jgi:hypothetical protein
MESPLMPFEKYVLSLTNLGVFPSFHRHSNGWTCVLRNGANKQIMPFNADDSCWGETMMDALTIAVEGLNRRFREPKELHKYIDTGLDQNDDSLQAVKTAYAQ